MTDFNIKKLIKNVSRTSSRYCYSPDSNGYEVLKSIISGFVYCIIYICLLSLSIILLY